MLKLIHITDLHLTADGSLCQGYDTTRCFERALAHITENHPDADCLVITGDLAHWGDRPAYEQLCKWLDAFTLPVELLIGNHDHRDNFFEVLGHRHPYQRPFAQYWRDVGDKRLIFLDTLLEGSHGGELCTQRLVWLESALSDMPGQALLFMHHQPGPLGAPALDAIGLKDASGFHAILREYRDRIAHIFHGHCHTLLQGHIEGVSVSGLRSLGAQTLPDLHDDQARGMIAAPHYAVAFVSDNSVAIHPVEFDYTGPVTIRSRQVFTEFAEQCRQRGVIRQLEETP